MARVLAAALLMLASMIVAVPATGFAQQAGVGTDIRQGTCEEPGDVVAHLNAATLPTGATRGNAMALPAASSFTTVPLSLQALTERDHALVIPFPAGEELVACGEIGGVFTEAGALVVGIRPEGMDISGIAYVNQGSDPAQANISLFVTGEDLDLFLRTSFSEPTVAKDDAARFAAALAARDGSPHLAGPFAGRLDLQQDLRTGKQANIAVTDFSTTVTVTNPNEALGSEWSIGFAFRGTPGTAQVIAINAGGTWTYQDPSSGTMGAGPLNNFDATPGATNTVALVVEGATASLGVNGELETMLDLPASTAADVVLVAGYAPEGGTITFSGFEVWEAAGAGTDVQSPTSADGGVEDDAALFATALTARDSERPVAGPYRGEIPQSMAGLAARPAGLITLDFAATVTFVNPNPQADAPWDGGLAFHLDSQAGTVQEVYFDSNGFWYHTDFPNGVQQSGIVPSFDALPGGTNTLDLIVVGDSALFGMNGEFLARLALPSPVPSDVMAASTFREENLVEGREITFTDFAVWDAPDLTLLSTTPPTSASTDNTAWFADALATRPAPSLDAALFANKG